MADSPDNVVINRPITRQNCEAPVDFSSERVICVDDSFPNPLCRFPEGYVVRGQIYHVIRVRATGGVVIAGKPVLNLFTGDEVGWKPHRFRKLHESEIEDNVEDTECVAV